MLYIQIDRVKGMLNIAFISYQLFYIFLQDGYSWKLYFAAVKCNICWEWHFKVPSSVMTVQIGRNQLYTYFAIMCFMVYHIVFNFLPSGTGCCNRYWCNQKVMGTSCNLFCWKCTAIAYSVLPLCQIVIYCKIDIKDPFPIKMSISNKYFFCQTHL